MLKVVYDYQVFTWQKYGGISRYVYDLATHINADADIETKILAIAYINEYLKACRMEGLVIGFPMLDFSSGTIQKLLSRFNGELSQWWLQKNHPDILHQTYYNSNYHVPKESRVVITVHDMVHEKFVQLFKHKNRLNLAVEDHTALAKRNSVERADHIICISENTKKDLIDILNVDPNKITVIYHGFSLNNCSGRPTCLNSSKPYILFVGNRGGYKNFERLIQAYSNSSRLKNNFGMLCFGGGQFTNAERKEMSSVGLDEHSIQWASGDDSALKSYYQNASVFVYPSLYEGFGIPLLEAMALGCPVACSNSSSMPEVVGNAAELFDPYESESIAKALETILFSTENSQSLIQRGRERVKSFSWNICSEKTKQVYLSLT